jgi:hypothetical protein
LKKLTKGVKKATKAAYNFAIGDDIRTLTSKKTKWYQKAGAAFSIASNFIPGGGLVTKAAKAVIKGTSKAVKAYKASKVVTKTAKVVKTTAKKVSASVNKKAKTVPASSIRSTPKTNSKALAKVQHITINPKPKITTPKPARNVQPTRAEKQLLFKPAAGDNVGSMLRGGGDGKGNELVIHPFSVGASHITTTLRWNRFPDSPTFGGPQGLYVAPKDQIDRLVKNSNSRRDIELMMGLEKGALDGGDLIRIDIDDPFSRNLRIPDPLTGNIFHRPGTGLTTGNINEAVIDSPLKGSSNVTTSIINLD